MTVLMLFAAAMIPLTIGVAAGWILHAAVTDLEDYENAASGDDADVLPFPDRPGA